LALDIDFDSAVNYLPTNSKRLRNSKNYDESIPSPSVYKMGNSKSSSKQTITDTSSTTAIPVNELEQTYVAHVVEGDIPLNDKNGEKEIADIARAVTDLSRVISNNTHQLQEKSDLNDKLRNENNELKKKLREYEILIEDLKNDMRIKDENIEKLSKYRQFMEHLKVQVEEFDSIF